MSATKTHVFVVDFDRLRGLISTGSSGVTVARGELTEALAELDFNAPRAAHVEDDRPLTYAEAAKWLSASDSYVEQMVREGRIKAVRLPGTLRKGPDGAVTEREGRSRRIMLSELRAFVKGGG